MSNWVWRLASMTDIKAMKIESQLIDVDDILDNKLSVTLFLNKIPYKILNNQTKFKPAQGAWIYHIGSQETIWLYIVKGGELNLLASERGIAISS